jgi:putative ATP-dependent endonuclease of OLD family
MKHCKNNTKAQQVLCDLFNELSDGGKTQKANFKNELENDQYWKCLRKIESKGIGKGRFSQRLSAVCSKEHIPVYIKNAINCIYQKVNVL